MKWLASCICWMGVAVAAAADLPKVAMFPLGGTSASAMRDRVGFSIRAKLDRDGAYEPIDGPTMADMAAAAKTTIGFDTSLDVIKDLAQDSGAVVLAWGDLSPGAGGDLLRLKVVDLRETAPAARTFERTIADDEQIRFAVEAFLETLPGVTPFSHPNEQAVHHDPVSDALFASNPNLVVDGDFSQPGHWDAIYQSAKYPVGISEVVPEKDKIAIYPLSGDDGRQTHNVLAMNLSYHAATNNGLACLSDAIAIEPGVRYRLAFKYRSDGPSLQVFVKGYTAGENIAGEAGDREVYRLQVPPSGATGGKWAAVEADLNPRNPDFVVQRLRVDLYAYMHPGVVMFEDVELKAVGRLEAPATRP